MPNRTRVTSRLVFASLGVAAFSFLCALGVGVVLVVGAKLQVPDLGAGASPRSVLHAVVVVSLGALGAPVDVGGVEVNAIPLAGIAFVGIGTIWATRRAMGVVPAGSSIGAADTDIRIGGAPRAGGPPTPRPPQTPQDVAKRPVAGPIATGLLVGAWLAVLAALSSWVFVIGSGADQIRASGAGATLAGFAWGSLFGACGALPRQPAQLRRLVGLRRSSANGVPAARAAFRMIVWFGILCMAVVVVGGALRIARAGTTPAAAAGSVLHGLAFAPNLAVTVGAVAVGAPVEAGFGRLDVGSAQRVPTYSIRDWDGRSPPAGVQFLVCLPLVCFTAVGMGLHRDLGPRVAGARAGDAEDVVSRLRRNGAVSIILCSVAFSSCFAVLAWLGEARLGVDLADEGFARLSPDALTVFLLALGWAIVGLVAGWLLDALWPGRRRRAEKRG